VFYKRIFTTLATSITGFYSATLLKAGFVGIGSRWEEQFEAKDKTLGESG
jgi:hypothetical protein